MAVDVNRTLKSALAELQSQRAEIDRQIAGLQAVIDGTSKTAATGRPRRTRRKRTEAEKKAISRRMKASWAKRKAAAKRSR